VKPKAYVFWLLVILIALVGARAIGQQVQFPSSVPTNNLVPVAPPPTPVFAPSPGPMAELQGNIQLPPPQWDPYAMPGTQSPTIIPQDPYLQGDNPMTLTNARRFLKEVRVENTWLSARGAKKFGIDSLLLSSTFTFPMFFNIDTPLEITPGFAFNWLEGPVTSIVGYPGTLIGQLPPRLYDTYLDSAWNPQVTPWLGGELAFRVGVYSDFKRVTAESVRYMGHGYAVLSFSPSVKIKFGIEYLDRIPVKLLPAGGIIWTPNSDTRFEILFPNPKIAKRLTTIGSADWWGYVRGEYGGGAWSGVPDKVDGADIDQIGYNDLRCGLGLEWNSSTFLDGLFEVGVAFDRELIDRNISVKFRPSTTVYIRSFLLY